MFKSLIESKVIPEIVEDISITNFYEQLPDLKFKNVDKAASLVKYSEVNGDTEVTFKLNLLTEKDERQLDDLFTLMSERLSFTLNDAFNPAAFILERAQEVATEAANITVGLPETVRLSKRLQDRRPYVVWLLDKEKQNLSEATLSQATLSQATLSQATLSQATLSEATLSEATLSEATLSEPTLAETNEQFLRTLSRNERTESWKRYVRSLLDLSLYEKYAVLRAMHNFQEANRQNELTDTLRTTILDKMRDRLLDEGDAEYIDFLNEGDTVRTFREDFIMEYNAEFDALILFTINQFKINDAPLKNYFDITHPDYRVDYPLVKNTIVPAFTSRCEIITTDDSMGSLYKRQTLEADEYTFVQPHFETKSALYGHQIEDKVAFTGCIATSIANLLTGLVAIPASTILTLNQKQFKGFVDVTSPAFNAILFFIKQTPRQEVRSNSNSLYRDMANSDDYEPIKRLVDKIKTSEEALLPLESNKRFEAEIVKLLEFQVFANLVGDIGLPTNLTILKRQKNYGSDERRKYEGSGFIDGRYIAVMCDNTLESDVTIYITYMQELITRLFKQETGFLSQIVQLLKTVEISIEILLTSFFTTGKIGIKWLSPLLSIPLIAGSPFVVLAKYFTDFFIYNYASPKTLGWLILEMLVLPLELITRAVFSYGEILFKTIEMVLVGLQGRIRVIWNDVAKEILVAFIELNEGHPTEDNFLIQKHSINGEPFFGDKFYHLDLRTSTHLVLCQIYSTGQALEEIEMRNKFNKQLQTINTIFREKHDEIRLHLTEKYPEFQTTKAEAYLNQKLQFKASGDERIAPMVDAPHEVFIANYPRGTLALYSNKEALIENILKQSLVSLENLDVLDGIEKVNILMGSTQDTENVKNIVFEPNTLQQFDASLSGDTNVSLREPVNSLFISEIVDSLNSVV